MKPAQAGEGYVSPEQAAMVGFPPSRCRVIASQSSGDHAYVLLDTGSPDQPYLYGANCFRKDGLWFDAGSSNGPGWQQVGDDPDLGTLSLWDDLPPDVEAVQVLYAGRIGEAVAQQGAFLVVWWRVPCPEEWPHVTAVQRNGIWTAW